MKVAQPTWRILLWLKSLEILESSFFHVWLKDIISSKYKEKKKLRTLIWIHSIRSIDDPMLCKPNRLKKGPVQNRFDYNLTKQLSCFYTQYRWKQHEYKSNDIDPSGMFVLVPPSFFYGPDGLMDWAQGPPRDADRGWSPWVQPLHIPNFASSILNWVK